MVMIKPDFSEAPKLPPGFYRAKIVSCTSKISQNKVPYLDWKFETISNDPATNRRWVFMSTTYNGKGALRLRDMVRAAIDPSYDQGPFDSDLLMGKEVMITVERVQNKDGSENPYPQVMDITPVDGAFEDFGGFGP